jgi:UDP-N-acetylglucosamine--N-acetylmuramyl-(pentapeptide) pyrophosphoryl-undecaprenol N-acetylglucosamine transferase
VDKTILLVAGGTGGHVFPALALREMLISRGHDVHIATDRRVGAFIDGVEADHVHTIRSATLSGNPVKLVPSLWRLASGLMESRGLLARLKPAAIIGFGGYPSVPPIMAARLSGVPAIVHEQNAVLGRANRLLIRLGARLATGMADPAGAERASEVVHVGNPVRQAIADAAATPFSAPGPVDRFRLLVFGGSQGAHVFSELVPAALGQLDDAMRERLDIVQQTREEDLDRTRSAYDALNVRAELSPFFRDMPERLARAHLVICRAGASTVAELSAVGRPAILVPYPHALDHDQAANAQSFCQSGGGWMYREAELSPDKLAERLTELMNGPELLAAAARAAKGQGNANAVASLADLVEKVAS